MIDNPRWKTGSKVQTLMFDRDEFTVKEAKAWAKKHKYKYGKVDVTEEKIRLRQEDPKKFQTFRTIEFTEGIKAVIGPMKKKYRKNPVRGYGLGKFDTILDQALYEMSLEGGADKEASSEGWGWYGLIYLEGGDIDYLSKISQELSGQPLTWEERELLSDHAGVTIWERTDGIVSVDYWENRDTLDDAWDEIEDTLYQDEEDDY